MPSRDGATTRMELLPLDERLKELDHCQDYWYELAAQYAKGLSVIDVGAGTGCGLPILSAGGASKVVGIDPLPAGPGVQIGTPESVADSSFDVAVAMDVIEHVEDDAAFLGHLLRIARRAVFVSTPNWDRFRCTNRFHFREYTAGELSALLSGNSVEAWCIDDRTREHLPWRTPAFRSDATNFGAWIWKGAPLRHRDEPRNDLWNSLPSPEFLAYDRPNPARAAAAAVVASSGAGRMVEVGPGAGYDYLDHFSSMPLSYVAYEGSSLLRAAFLRSAPAADVRAGGFLDLAPDSFDLCYTKATLEHQRDFRDGLRRMVLAAPRVVVNWYLPPDAEGKPCYSGEQGIWYNRYRRVDVANFLYDLGCLVVERPQPPPGNSLWIVNRRLP